MYVPPYVPQPIEIPGNAAEEPYLVRLGFVRRVVFLHILTVALAAIMAYLPLPLLPPIQAAGIVLILLVVLSMVRGMAKGRQADVRISTFLLPVLLLGLALWLRALFDEGWGVWAAGVGLACAVAYVAASGRDLSFVGMFVVAFIASSCLIALAGWRFHLAGLEVANAIILNGAFLFYYVYDLAALLTRRRLGEEWGAVVDLYRDVLNGLTYPIRVFRHWKEHRIWNPR